MMFHTPDGSARCACRQGRRHDVHGLAAMLKDRVLAGVVGSQQAGGCLHQAGASLLNQPAPFSAHQTGESWAKPGGPSSHPLPCDTEPWPPPPCIPGPPCSEVDHVITTKDLAKMCLDQGIDFASLPGAHAAAAASQAASCARPVGS